jgi:hypothetical protein
MKAGHRQSSVSRSLVLPFVLGGLCIVVSGSTARAEDQAPSTEPQPTTAPAPAVAAAPQEAVPQASRTVDPESTLSARGYVPPDWLKGLSIGGGAILWYFQPINTGAENNVDLFFANLLLDGRFGIVGLHIEPRFRDSRLRDFYPGPVWAQEAYLSVKVAPGTVIKAGKEYSHFGLFWDNSFYGNVQVYDGLKLDPDYGLSLETSLRPNGRSGLRAYAQYFVVDGHTNVSLDGRDTISIPGASRRNQAILRAEPFFKPNDATTITGGVSGEFLQADLPTVGTKDVYRAGADASVSIRNWALWADYIYQNGQTVTDFPIAPAPATATTAAVAGQASAHNHYVLAGTQLTWKRITARYNVSTGRYQDLAVSEWMHVPAVAVAVGDNLTVLGEYVNWKRYAPTQTTVVDQSFNVTLNGHF